jgi:hypothetical protein
MKLINNQFPDLVNFSEKMANGGKTVIVAALDGMILVIVFISMKECH